ncbi:TRAP transporter small permease [Hoeflea sp.]|uniref:TRAP transporter small permease n=1 Tax=Hoeflea sp. TaxID=1940281 RepID=UPI003B01BC8E
MSVLDVIIQLTQAICSVVLVGMLVTVLANVIARSVFSISLGFGDEYAAYALVALAFLGAPVAYRKKRSMMQVTMLYERWSASVRSYLDVLWHLIGLAFSSTLLFYLGVHWLSTFDKGTISTTSTNTPLWMPQLLMPLGSALLAVVVFACLIESIRGIARRQK